eukprot:3422853-Rhodomonas_salina.1
MQQVGQAPPTHHAVAEGLREDESAGVGVGMGLRVRQGEERKDALAGTRVVHREVAGSRSTEGSRSVAFDAGPGALSPSCGGSRLEDVSVETGQGPARVDCIDLTMSGEFETYEAAGTAERGQDLSLRGAVDQALASQGQGAAEREAGVPRAPAPLAVSGASAADSSQSPQRHQP